MSSFDNLSDNASSILDDVNDFSSNDRSDTDRYFIQDRSLWRAVILQAIIDIINNSSRTENKIAKIETKQWVFQDNEDFQEVCSLAGYTVSHVRKKIMEIMRQNFLSKMIIGRTNKEDKFMSLLQNLMFGKIFNIKLSDYEKLASFSYC